MISARNEGGDGRRRPTLLEVERLTIGFGAREPVVRDVSFSVSEGETVGIVGASGAGKTLTALSVLGLLPRGARALEGRVLWRGRNLLEATTEELRAVRGSEIGMVFQDALAALHPAIAVTDQVAEALTAHRPVTRREARRRASRLLDEFGIALSHARTARYSHEWSGGMRQRAMIAMAMANGPDLLIADEPTTALDVTTQARVLDVLRMAQARSGAALLLITHDLGVVAELADRVLVLDAGRVVESLSVRDLFVRPSHPRTRELLASRPGATAPGNEARPAGRDLPVRRGRVGDSAPRPALEAEGLVVRYPARRRQPSVTAVDDVSFRLDRGETLALVGESGCGKTTLARTLVGLKKPARGRVRLEGTDLLALRGPELRRALGRIQIVFQDPHASLNPRQRVGEIIAQPLRVHGRARESRARAAELLERVGLAASDARRLPHEFSAGQRQRIAIARALALEPRVLVADEPVTSLDPHVAARVIALLDELRRELGLALLLIAHDLPLVRDVADRIAVMYLGRIVETGPAADVCANPRHPYTRELLAAVPALDPARRRPLVTELSPAGVADPGRPPAGCRFHPRCSWSGPRCAVEPPPLEANSTGRLRACYVDELGAGVVADEPSPVAYAALCRSLQLRDPVSDRVGDTEVPPCGCAAPGTVAADACYCGVEDLLQIIRRRYSLAVLQALHSAQPARYRDIAAALPAASSSTLADTLRALVAVRLVRHDGVSSDPPVATYSLTASGSKLLKRLRRLLEDVRP